MRSSKLTAVLAVTSVLAASAVIQTASGVTVAPPLSHHVYVTITGSRQGVFKNDTGTAGAIEAMKLSYGVTEVLAGTVAVAGAIATGVRNYAPIHFSKMMGLASGELLASMINNEVLPLVQIDFVRDNPLSGQPLLIARIELTNARVLGIQNTTDASGAALVPLEDIALVAETFKFSFTVTSATGVQATPYQILDPSAHFVLQ